MTFDVAELPGRASELYQAAKEAGETVRHPENGVPPEWSLTEGEVTAVYNDFLDIPAPEDFEMKVKNLLEAMQKLATEGFQANQYGEDPLKAPPEPANSDLTGVSSAGIEIDDWTGKAADSFFLNYGQNFVPTTSSLFQAYYLMRHALNAEAAVWQTVREDLDALSKNATEQMRHVDESTADDWKAILKVAGAAVAVAGAVPSGGASLSVVTVIGAGVTVSSTGMDLATEPDKKDKVKVATGTPRELSLANDNPQTILNELVRALGEIKRDIKSAETQIGNAVQAAADAMANNWNSFCLPRPALADVPRGSVHSHDNMGTV